MTRKSYPGAAGRRKPQDITQYSGPEPVWAAAAGYGYIRADSETDALMALRAGLETQLEQLDDFIIERLEAKLKMRR